MGVRDGLIKRGYTLVGCHCVVEFCLSFLWVSLGATRNSPRPFVWMAELAREAIFRYLRIWSLNVWCGLCGLNEIIVHLRIGKFPVLSCLLDRCLIGLRCEALLMVTFFFFFFLISNITSLNKEINTGNQSTQAV